MEINFKSKIKKIIWKKGRNWNKSLPTMTMYFLLFKWKEWFVSLHLKNSRTKELNWSEELEMPAETPKYMKSQLVSKNCCMEWLLTNKNWNEKEKFLEIFKKHFNCGFLYLLLFLHLLCCLYILNLLKLLFLYTQQQKGPRKHIFPPFSLIYTTLFLLQGHRRSKIGELRRISVTLFVRCHKLCK